MAAIRASRTAVTVVTTASRELNRLCTEPVFIDIFELTSVINQLLRLQQFVQVYLCVPPELSVQVRTKLLVADGARHVEFPVGAGTSQTLT